MVNYSDLASEHNIFFINITKKIIARRICEFKHKFIQVRAFSKSKPKIYIRRFTRNNADF